MKKAFGRVAGISCACALGWVALTHAQLPNLGRGGQDWSTSSADAQRTSWIKTDYAISPESMQKPGFGLLWKLKLEVKPSGMNSLTQPVMSGQAGGARGFKSLAYLGASSNTVYSVDTDLQFTEWAKSFNLPAGESTAGCPAGMTAAITRPTTLAVTPGRGFGGNFPGRGVAFSSGVGEPGQGAPDIFHTGGQAIQFGGGGAAPAGGRGAAGGPGGPGAPAGGNDAAARGRGPGGGGGFGGASGIYAVTSDGVLRTLGAGSGKEISKPVPFLPAGSNVSALIDVDNTVYAATSAPCGGAANALWALNISTPAAGASPAEPVSWKTDGGPIVGDAGVALGGDGTIYAAVGKASTAGSGYSNAIVALAPKTLTLKDSFSAPDADFSSTPVIFKYKDRELIAAATKDGKIYLLDATSLGGSDHKTPLAVTSAFASAKTDFAPASLASWESTDGTRWILEAFAGSSPTGVSGNGGVKNGGILALRVSGDSGNLSLSPAWVSRDMNSPLTPMIVNGVVFAIASGQFHGLVTTSAAERAKHSIAAVLYALDAGTGKELWNSGKSITSFASAGLSESPGQVYVVTYDGGFYTFGMPSEREQD